MVAKRKQQAVASLTRSVLNSSSALFCILTSQLLRPSGRMNSTLAQLLNNISLKLNSPLNVDGQIPANASVLAANASEANTSLADGSATNSATGEQNSTIASFAALQSEVGEVTKM